MSVVAFHRDHDESAQLGAAVKVAEQSVSREVLISISDYLQSIVLDGLDWTHLLGSRPLRCPRRQCECMSASWGSTSRTRIGGR